MTYMPSSHTRAYFLKLHADTYTAVQRHTAVTLYLKRSSYCCFHFVLQEAYTACNKQLIRHAEPPGLISELLQM